MIYCIIPTRNRLKLLKQNIQSVRNQTVKQTQIIVIDDGSNDGTQQWLAAKKDIFTITGNGNLWWTGAMRKGVEHVLTLAKDDDLILTMNDDCEFDGDYIGKLIACQKKLPAKSIVGSICYLDRGRGHIINAGAMIELNNNWGFGTKLKPPVNFQKHNPIPVDLLSGKGTLIPVKAFKIIGNYDKALPHYGADYEFSYRAKKHGFQPYICYQAEVFNQQSDGGFNEKQTTRSWKEYQNIFFSRRSKRNVWYRLVYLSKTTPWWNVARGIILICIELFSNLTKIRKN